MKLAYTALAIALTGCASSSQTYTADGRVGHTLNCSGEGRNWGMCEAKAGEICGARGYTVLSKSSDSSGGVFASGVVSRNMLISCK